MENRTPTTSVVAQHPWLRWPAAQLDASGGRVEWAGSASDIEEVVVWAGVELEHAGSSVEQHHRLTHESLSAAFDHLLLLPSLPAERRGQHLVEHVRQFGCSDLCAAHGLPVWHVEPPREPADPDSRTGPVTTSCPNAGALLVADALRQAEALDTVLDAASRIRRRQQMPSNIATQLVGLCGTDYARWMRAHLATTPMTAARARQAVGLAVRRQFADNRVRPTVTWVAQKRPELVLVSATTWGLLAVELARRLSTDGTGGSVYECAACGDPVVRTRRPRAGDGIYCPRPECQRTRWRRNKERQRVEGEPQ